MLPLQDQLYVVQSDIIKDIAEKENCVREEREFPWWSCCL